MEKGVSVWLRDADTDEWHRAVVVKLGDPAAAAAGGECQVTLRLTEGPHARAEKTLNVDVHALEDEEVEGVLLANNSDMVGRSFFPSPPPRIYGILSGCSQVLTR